MPLTPALRRVCLPARAVRSMLAAWVPGLNSMDELWVPTEHSRRVLKASGVRVPMHVVPLAVNTTQYDPARHAPAKLPMGHQVLCSHDGHACTCTSFRRCATAPFPPAECGIQPHSFCTSSSARRSRG